MEGEVSRNLSCVSPAPLRNMVRQVFPCLDDRPRLCFQCLVLVHDYGTRIAFRYTLRLPGQIERKDGKSFLKKNKKKRKKKKGTCDVLRSWTYRAHKLGGPESRRPSIHSSIRSVRVALATLCFSPGFVWCRFRTTHRTATWQHPASSTFVLAIPPPKTRKETRSLQPAVGPRQDGWAKSRQLEQPRAGAGGRVMAPHDDNDDGDAVGL
ncbi:hypothetical protein LZ31DRAFT_376289 [Colletotrichum somersetense]|nr:hypothetical protein LZ31DRAFT_376289 [Colletotrichum somersetense]